ncbi:GNAT family N-acetyltransferase [Propionibacteriaceae bacterium Y2011]|uniref:GNAT family N-acetyltransferase n=1 Tax=Microlunatus sp. Y2014 TaxID=3418488 RepID=UPI003B4B7F48
MSASDIILRWRHPVSDAEIVELTRAHGGNPEPGWWDKVQNHSLGWVTARAEEGSLVGFVNVAWDGGAHAFLVDTKTHPSHQRQGIGTMIVRRAAQEAKRAGCEWLFVDFDSHLESFYLDACGFRPTAAGLIHLPSAAT